MTTPEHELFFQALRSAADRIEPRSDGMDQIRARLHRRPYPLPVACAAAAWMRLMMRVNAGADSAGRQVADKLRLASAGVRSAGRQVAGKVRWAYTEEIPAEGKLRTISEWFLSDLPEPVADDARAGKLSSWSLLRPLAAFGVAVFIVAVGAYVAIEVPAGLSTQNNQTPQQTGGNGGGHHGTGGLANRSSSPFPGSGPSGLPWPSGSASTPYPCITLPGPSGGRSASPSPTTSRSGSPSPSNSGSPSPSTSPTPTPSATPTPSSSPPAAAGVDQPTAAASAGAARTTTDAVILPAQPTAPSVNTSKSSCGTPRPRRTKKKPASGLPDATPNPGLGGSFTPAKSARHQSKNSA